jgi:hypothetical protein
LVGFRAKHARGVGGGREKAPGPANGDSGIKEQERKRGRKLWEEGAPRPTYLLPHDAALRVVHVVDLVEDDLAAGGARRG